MTLLLIVVKHGQNKLDVNVETTEQTFRNGETENVQFLIYVLDQVLDFDDHLMNKINVDGKAPYAFRDIFQMNWEFVFIP